MRVHPSSTCSRCAGLCDPQMPSTASATARPRPLAALAQAAFIAGSVVFVGLEAFDRLLHPQPIANVKIGLAVLGLSVVATS